MGDGEYEDGDWLRVAGLIIALTHRGVSPRLFGNDEDDNTL